MANINEILARAAALRDETALNSIDPERAGGIMYDTLIALNELWLQQGAALVISKIYSSVAAMNADTSPVSDLTGKPIRPGMIVVIASSDSDNGSVYRYNGTSAPRWSLVGKIGNLEPVDSLDSDSTQLPLAAHQGKVLDGKISQLVPRVSAEACYNLSLFSDAPTFSTKASARVFAVATKNLPFAKGVVLMYLLNGNLVIERAKTDAVSSQDATWEDITEIKPLTKEQKGVLSSCGVYNLSLFSDVPTFATRADARLWAISTKGLPTKKGQIFHYLLSDGTEVYEKAKIDAVGLNDSGWGKVDTDIFRQIAALVNPYGSISSFGSGATFSIGINNNCVITFTDTTNSGGLSWDYFETGQRPYAIRVRARAQIAGQIIRVGEGVSGSVGDFVDIELGTEYKDYFIYLSGVGKVGTASYHPSFTYFGGQKIADNVINIDNFIISEDGDLATRLAKLENKPELNYTYPITSRTGSFMQSISRGDKPLTKIAIEGDSLMANAIGGTIPQALDEGETARPMRLLSNNVARRLYDKISWNKPIWRRLDNVAWTLSGFSEFTESGMFEGTQESYWKAEQAGAYVEITIPNGYEHFAIIVRTKSGNGKLNVTLNGGVVGTYLNPYYTDKVATNTIVDASVVPQYIPRGLSQIDTNKGVSATGNPYAMFEFHNLPSGDNVLRFTTDDSNRVDVWGGLYWSGNTIVVMNIAHGGHTTTDLRNQHLTDELYNGGYDCVLFEVTEQNNLSMTIEQTISDLTVIVEKLREIDIDHCFTSCNPLGLSILYDTNFYTQFTDPTQEELNLAVREFMNEKGIPFIDIFKYFEWHIVNRGGTLSGGEGGLWYTHDGQHGNPAGVKLWFDALQKVIANTPIMISE